MRHGIDRSFPSAKAIFGQRYNVIYLTVFLITRGIELAKILNSAAARAAAQHGAPQSPRVRNGVIWIVAVLVMASAALYIFSLVG